jgi:hypothetical protein
MDDSLHDETRCADIAQTARVPVRAATEANAVPGASTIARRAGALALSGRTDCTNV